MISSVLEKRNCSLKMIVTTKSIISLCLCLMAIVIPQIFHMTIGTQSIAWLPMYLPVLLAGLLLGVRFGFVVGILSPICSYLFTSFALQLTMPTLGNLPYMIVELAVYGFVSGLFANWISKTPLLVFPAILATILAGRLSCFLVQIITTNPSIAINQVISGYKGLILQITLVPLIIILFQKRMVKEKHE